MKAKRMKAARIILGMNQLDLANKVGVSETLISRIETGRHEPPRELKERIASVLNIATYEVGR